MLLLLSAELYHTSNLFVVNKLFLSNKARYPTLGAKGKSFSICSARPFSEAIFISTFRLFSKLGCLDDSFCIIYKIRDTSYWQLSRKFNIRTFNSSFLTLGFTPQGLRNSTARTAKSLLNCDEKIPRISCSSGNSPHLEDAKIKLDIVSFSSSGNCLNKHEHTHITNGL